MTLRKNPISFDEAVLEIEGKRWPQPKKESIRSRQDREAYNHGIDEAIIALSHCKRLPPRRRAPRKASVKP